MLDDRQLFTVTDLKQYRFCPRVIFYEHCLPHIRPRTYKMDAGRDEHELEQKRATRRTLSKYHVVNGERRFDLALTNIELKLTGVIDETVFTSSGEVFPVDYKLAKKVAANHKIQLSAYALLLENELQISIDRGFIYLIPQRKMEEVTITDRLRSQTTTLFAEMEEMVTTETIPLPTKVRNRCVSCEFRRFCNDV